MKDEAKTSWDEMISRVFACADTTFKLTIVEAKSEAIIVLKKVFDQAGIEIPFPIRTLHHKNLSSLSAS